MKYTSEQVSQAWRSYVASRHSTQRRDDGGEIKHKHKLKHKKEQKEIASTDAQVEHGRSSASTTQHRAGGGIIEGKPGIDTNDAKLRPGAFVIPKKKVPDAIRDGILRPKKAEKFQDGGVPVKLTAGEGLLSPEKASRLHAEGVDLNEYAPDTEFPYQPDSLTGMQNGGYLLADTYTTGGNNPFKRNEARYQSTHPAPSVPEKPIVPVKSTKRLATKNKPSEDKDTRTDAEKQKQTQSDFDAMVKRNIIGKPHGAGGSWTPEKPSFIRDFGQATVDDLGYLGEAWNAVGQGMYSAGKGIWDGLGWLNEKLGSGTEPQKKNNGGKIKMQEGGLTPSTMTDASLDISKDESDPEFQLGKSMQNAFPEFKITDLFASKSPVDLNAKTPSLLNTPFQLNPTIPTPVGGNIVNTFKDNSIDFNRKQETAADNSKRLQQSIVGNNATQITDKSQQPTNSLIASNNNTSNVSPSFDGTKQPLSLFDQVRKDEKRYTDITTAEDLALLAGNLGSRYHPTPRPISYTPDIYERNTNAEAIEQGKNLDKEAATARYNARNTGQGRVSDPAITANLMDKRLALGAETDTTRENERKSVYEQRNQASLMNLNQNNQYNTMEANRLDQFRAQKGQESMKMVDRLQDVYKSSIEDKYTLLGAENQAKIAQEQAKNQFFASFGTTPSQAMQTKFDGDYSDWVKNNPSPKPDDIKEFIDDWKTKNPQQ